MVDKVYVVTDLGPGDGGKGSIIHALGKKLHASVIIKRGGAQGSHGVKTSKGDRFNFSQWGCGTWDGIPTYCSNQMIVSPQGLVNEAQALHRLGFYNPWELLTVSPFCLCATQFHKLSSQLEEILRGNNPRGTIGTGVGQAYRMRRELGPEFSITVSELTNRNQVCKKLNKQAEYYRNRYADVTTKGYLGDDVDTIKHNLTLLNDPGFVTYQVDVFEDVGNALRGRLKQLNDVLDRADGVAIVECSHGILTDAREGLRPHVSAIRTLPEETEKMLREFNYNGPIVNLGVHRAYEVRHGAGPMPTYDQHFTDMMLPGSHKETNRWQGEVRAGPLDLNLLNYALESTSVKFDGICLTWFDQILQTDRKWSYSPRYQNDQNILETYTDYLKHADPVINSISIPNPISKRDLFNLVNDALVGWIDVPLSILSIGSTETDKIYTTNTI